MKAPSLLYLHQNQALEYQIFLSQTYHRNFEVPDQMLFSHQKPYKKYFLRHTQTQTFLESPAP